MARYTTAMPPMPRALSSRYLPRRTGPNRRRLTSELSGANLMPGASYQAPCARSEVGPGAGSGEHVVGGVVRVGNELRRDDRVRLVERAACGELAERSAVGRGMAGADLENRAVGEHDAHDAVGGHPRASDANERHGHDGAVIDAVDEIADAQRRDGTITVRRRDRCVGRRADRAEARSPPPVTSFADDGQIAIAAALRARH